MLRVETPAEPGRIALLESEVAQLRARLDAVTRQLPLNQATLCVLSGDYERVMSALMLAHMAAALEMDVTIFFTFWGVQAIRKSRSYRGKSVIEKAMARILKRDIGQLASGRLNFGGVGPVIFEQLMKKKNVATPQELLEGVGPARIRLAACTTSIDVFGITPAELIPGVVHCGAAEFVEMASRSKINLFI